MRKKMSGKVTSRDTLAVNDAVYSEVVRKPTSNGGMIASTPKAPPPTDRNSDHIYDLPQDYINHGNDHPFESWIYDTTDDEVTVNRSARANEDDACTDDEDTANEDTANEDTGNEDTGSEDTENEDTDNENDNGNGDDIDMVHLSQPLQRARGRSRTPSPANTTMRRTISDEDDVELSPNTRDAVVGLLSPAHLISPADRNTHVDDDTVMNRKTQYGIPDEDNAVLPTKNRSPMPLPSQLNDAQSSPATRTATPETEVPLIVSSCIRFLSKERNITQEGIFRENGNVDEVKSIMDGFRFGEDPLDASGDVRAHAVASCLKQFLRQRSDAVLGTNNYADWLAVVSLRKHDEKIKAAQRILQTATTTANLNILFTLIPFLRNVVDNSADNRMSLSALATVLGPTLLFPPPDTDPRTLMVDADKINDVVALLISEQDMILAEIPCATNDGAASAQTTRWHESNIYDDLRSSDGISPHTSSEDFSVPEGNESLPASQHEILGSNRSNPTSRVDVVERSQVPRSGLTPVVDNNGIYSVVLHRESPQESFGVDFETLENNFKVVCWVTKGGLADGKVAVDDTILAVNGFDCLPEAHATIVDVFRTASTIELRMAKIPEHMASAEAKHGSQSSDETPERVPPPKKQRSLMSLFRPRRKKDKDPKGTGNPEVVDKVNIPPAPAVFDDDDDPSESTSAQHSPLMATAAGKSDKRNARANTTAPTAVGKSESGCVDDAQSRSDPLANRAVGTSSDIANNESFAVRTSDVGNPAAAPARNAQVNNNAPATTGTNKQAHGNATVSTNTAPRDGQTNANTAAVGSLRRRGRSMPPTWTVVDATITRTDPSERMGIHLISHHGWHVLGRVTHASLADRAGARTGDVLVSVNGMNVTDPNMSHQACVDIVRVAFTAMGSAGLDLQLYRPDRNFLRDVTTLMERVHLDSETNATTKDVREDSIENHTDMLPLPMLNAEPRKRGGHGELPGGAERHSGTEGTVHGGTETRKPLVGHPSQRRQTGNPLGQEATTESPRPLDLRREKPVDGYGVVPPTHRTSTTAALPTHGRDASPVASRVHRNIFMSAREELEMLEALDNEFKRGLAEDAAVDANTQHEGKRATPTGRWQTPPVPGNVTTESTMEATPMPLAPPHAPRQDHDHDHHRPSHPQQRRLLYYDDTDNPRHKSYHPAPVQHRRFVYRVPTARADMYSNGGIIVRRNHSRPPPPPSATPDDVEEGEHFPVPQKHFVDRSKYYYVRYPDEDTDSSANVSGSQAVYKRTHPPPQHFYHHHPRSMTRSEAPFRRYQSNGRQRMIEGLNARSGRSPYE